MPRTRITFGGKSIVPYRTESEIREYTSGLVTPLSKAQIILLNKFVTELKAGLGISHLNQAFDVMYILAGETPESSLRNLVKGAHHATAVNSPTFTVYEGYQRLTTTSYINTNFIPLTDSIIYERYSHSDGCYMLSDITNMSYVYGCANNAPASVYNAVAPRITDKFRGYDLNSSLNEANNIISYGMFSKTRSNTTVKGYQNTTELFSNTSTANIHNEIAIFLLGYNSFGTINSSPGLMSFYFAGKYFTIEEITVIMNIFESYMDARGKGVIN